MVEFELNLGAIFLKFSLEDKISLVQNIIVHFVCFMPLISELELIRAKRSELCG